MGLQININGTPINLDDLEGANGVSFVFRRRDEDGGAAFSFSPELRARGAAFALLDSIFLCDTDGATKSADVLVYDECCKSDDNPTGLIFTGKIDGADLAWCTVPFCYVDFSIVDNSSDAAAITCLKNTIIWSTNEGATAGEDTARAARYVPYCVDMRPPILQDFILTLGILLKIVLAPVVYVVAAIVQVINTIISAVNILGANIPLIDFDGNDDTNAFQEATALFGRINELIVGCGRSHKAPFIHSYLSNLCKICGLTLSSSLFEPGGPYYNLMRLDATRTKGRRQSSDIEAAFLENRPNLNGVQFLDEFSEFNIEWIIKDGRLIIERRDVIAGANWFNLDDIPKDNILELCFNYTEVKPPAFAEYTYQTDGVDAVGDEVNKRYTQSVIDWNTPPAAALSGLFEKTLSYGTPQFRRDALRPDTSPLDRPFYSSPIGYPNVLEEYKNALLMSKGTAFLPKLLLFDGVDLPERRAFVRRYPNGDLWHYQPELYIYEDLGLIPNGAPPGVGTLYQSLLFLDDPRAAGVRIRSFTLKINFNCELKNAAPNAPGLTIGLPYCGVNTAALVEEIEISEDDQIMTISGKI